MKKAISILLAASLTLGSAGNAFADRGGHHHRHFRPPVPHHHHHHRPYRSDWVGPAAVLAITGLAIGAATYGSRAYAEPAPVYQAPPANPGIWYYCGSSGQYYPYTQACPEGWQAVPAR